MMKGTNSFMRTAAVALAAFAAVGFLLVAERTVAAGFSFWKFSGFESESGIDLGAHTALLFLTVSLLALGACVPLAHFASAKQDKYLTRLVMTASGFVVVSGTLILMMILSGAAFFYCGR